MPAPALDPGRCWVRHVKRSSSSSGITQVLEVRFAPEPLEGINGRQGWQSATPECRLSDDGSFTLRLPNAPGEDGKRHADRFAILTDTNYRPGEEWLEFYREPRDLLFVGTPVRARRDANEIEISGLDGMALLANARASEIDLLVGAAPFEVFERYTSVPVLRVGQNFAGWAPGTTLPGWTIAPTAAAAPEGDGILLTQSGSTTVRATYTLPAALTGKDFILELAWRHVSNESAQGGIVLGTTGLKLDVRHSNFGSLSGSGLPTMWDSTAALTAKPVTYALPGTVVHRIVARGEWVYCYANGELIIHARRDLEAAELAIYGQVASAQAVLQSARFVTLEPMLMRAGAGDRRLPGAPPAGGLRGRYYLEADTRAQRQGGGATAFVQSTCSPLLEPYAERLENVNFARTDPPAWQPPGPPSGNDFSARWTGAIHLDLRFVDRRLRLSVGDHGGRVWIGGRLVIDTWGNTISGQVFSERLRGLLDGGVNGWYPIKIEAWFGNSGPRGLILESGIDDGFGVTTWGYIPASDLSPIGTVDHEARHQVHREVIGDIAESFGYQWTLEPRSLESGEFPGQFIPRVRAGKDVATVVDASSAMEMTQEIDAADTIDALVVDASGLADLTEGAQITHEAFLPPAPGGHLMYVQGYESLADISELGLLRTRTESLLLLRSSPNEVVGVRPEGKRELVPAFPLVAGGPLERMLWRPGYGVRIRYPDFGVIDATPRQLTSVSWPLRPDGAAPPVVSFRQRARGARATLERVGRAAYAPQRHPQGRVVTLQGSLGGQNASSIPDPYSRMPAPDDLNSILGLEFHVLFKGGTDLCAIEVNSVSTGLTFRGPGSYDVSAWVTRLGATERRLYARVSNVTPDALEYMLIARVRV